MEVNTLSNHLRIDQGDEEENYIYVQRARVYCLLLLGGLMISNTSVTKFHFSTCNSLWMWNGVLNRVGAVQLLLHCITIYVKLYVERGLMSMDLVHCYEYGHERESQIFNQR